MDAAILVHDGVRAIHTDTWIFLQQLHGSTGYAKQYVPARSQKLKKMNKTLGLRLTIFKGGVLLLSRHVASVALKLVGLYLITRVLGPTEYAPYVSALNIYQCIFILGEMGIGIFLLRHPGGASDRSFRVAYTILSVTALVLMLLAWILSGPISRWTVIPNIELVIHLLILGLPFQLLSVPATIKLERELNYAAVAAIEISGQIIYYSIALALVLSGYGAIGLALSFLGQQLATFILAHVISRSVPRFAWDSSIVIDLYKFGLSFSSGQWMWQGRLLINPLVAGHYLDAHSVGLIGITIGLLDMLSIGRGVARRMSIAVLSRIQDDKEKVLKAITQGTQLLMLVVGLPLVVFSMTGSFLIPLLFGSRWSQLMDIYPYVALGYLAQAYFSMESAALSVFNRNYQILLFSFVHVLIFIASSAYLIPKVGIAGYGLGEVAAISSYYLVNRGFVKEVGTMPHGLSGLWFIGFGIGIFSCRNGIWSVLVPIFVLLLPASVKRISMFWKTWRG